MKLSSKLNIFKKSYKLVKKLWKKTKKGKNANKELEPVNIKMLNSNINEVEFDKCNVNLISEDVISEASYILLTSIVRGESTSEESAASVDSNLEKPSIVYAPEFMQNEGGEKNMFLPGVELETQKSESKNLPSEENITTEKPVSELEQAQNDIENDFDSAFHTESCCTLTKLLFSSETKEPRTHQTLEELIVQIEAEHKTKNDALIQLPESENTLLSSNSDNNISSSNADNNDSLLDSENTISSPTLDIKNHSHSQAIQHQSIQTITSTNIIFLSQITPTILLTFPKTIHQITIIFQIILTKAYTQILTTH